MASSHDQAVQTIQSEVRNFYTRKQKVRIFHGSTNSTRPYTAGQETHVDVSRLTNVLEVDPDEQYALVEPNVPLDKLVDACLEYGMVPPVIAEFPGITIGGAVQGGSAESSSFKHGGFHDTCLEYEVILGNGKKVKASRSENADLFWGMSCAYGSLGIITLVKINLIPATKYVRLAYHSVASQESAVKTIQSATKTEADFVDGILFSPNSGVVMTGIYTNDESLPIARFRSAIDDWFYIHAGKITVSHDYYEELIPLRDYLFRYDRGGFWVAKYGFGRFPFNRFTRFIFASLFKTRTLYRILNSSNYSYKYLAQDICLPENNIVKFLDFADKQYAIYPLWLCPLKRSIEDKLAPYHLDTKLVINVGIWGDMKPSDLSFTDRNRQLETEVETLNGRKVLYAHAYYTPDEFWNIYDKNYYDALRSKYQAAVVFPDLYAKVAVKPPTFMPSKWRGVSGLLRSPYNK